MQQVESCYTREFSQCEDFARDLARSKMCFRVEARYYSRCAIDSHASATLKCLSRVYAVNSGGGSYWTLTPTALGSFFIACRFAVFVYHLPTSAMGADKAFVTRQLCGAVARVGPAPNSPSSFKPANPSDILILTESLW